MSLVLLKKITDRAVKTYTEPDPPNNQHWYNHWFNTADNIRKEFEQEGLPNSAAEINRIVAEQKRFSRLVRSEYRPTDEDLGIHPNEGP